MSSDHVPVELITDNRLDSTSTERNSVGRDVAVAVDPREPFQSCSALSYSSAVIQVKCHYDNLFLLLLFNFFLL